MENLNLQLTAALLNDVFRPKNSVTTEYLEWHYHKNPAGSACIGYILEESKQITNYALIPKILKNNQGKKVKLGVGVDLAVSPNSRGKGLFRETIESSYKAGTNGNLDGILGVANSQSSPRMTQAMGWRKLPSLDFRLLIPSRSKNRLKTFRMEPDLIEKSETEGFFDVETFTNSFGFSPLWDKELLKWRLSRPGGNYYLHASDSAILITTRVSIGGMKMAILLKAFSLNPKETPIPIGSFVSDITKYHKTPFVSYWGKNPHFKMSGIKIPRKFQPSPLDLVVHFFESKINFELDEFELLDFDAF